MPFSSVKQMEKKHKKRLSKYFAKAKRIFRNVFNSVLEKTGDEGRAFREAHSVANKYDEEKENLDINDSNFDMLVEDILKDLDVQKDK